MFCIHLEGRCILLLFGWIVLYMSFRSSCFIMLFKSSVILLIFSLVVLSINKSGGGFPGGAVVESLPANAGDTGSSPGPGRSHMPRSNWAREPQLLSLRIWSLCSATRGRDSERPAHHDEEWPPLAATRESPRTETKTQQSQKYK